MEGIYTTPNEKSFKSKQTILREAFLSSTHPAPVQETPLPENKDFDYWSNRMRRRQVEALETEEERQHIKITLSQSSLVNFIGDIHAGNAHTDYDRLEREVGVILNTPNSYAVLLGDLIDNFGWFPPAHEADSPVPDQVEYGWALIRRLSEAKKLLAGWTGNHDDTWGKRGGNSMYKRFARETGAHLMSGLGFIDLGIKEQEFHIAGAHQLLGYSFYNANHPQQRAYRFGGAWGADVVVSAHTHAKSIQTVPMQEYGFKNKRVHYLNLGAYKWTDGYIRDKGFGDKALNGQPSELLYGCAVMFHESGQIEPQYDILEAHERFVTLHSEP